MKKFAAIELSVQPYLRSHIKKHLYLVGVLSTDPTEEGTKILDLFHPSYRAKRIQKMKLSDIQKSSDTVNSIDNGLADIFLDIVHNEEKSLIKVTIGLDDNDRNQLLNDLLDKFAPP